MRIILFALTFRGLKNVSYFKENGVRILFALTFRGLKNHMQKLLDTVEILFALTFRGLKNQIVQHFCAPDFICPDF